jgi:hypothetical protein
MKECSISPRHQGATACAYVALKPHMILMNESASDFIVVRSIAFGYLLCSYHRQTKTSTCLS